MSASRSLSPTYNEDMPKILIADDNKLNADLLEAHLDGGEFETKIAANGEETLRLAKEWQPDVVLLDVMMPKLSGFEVCKRLRTDPATKSVGVLMVTALDQPTDVERAVDVGTDDFLTKPINKTELLLRVRALMEAKKQSGDVDRGLAYFGKVQQGL
jgi:CheY-like chemotaxis protein